MDYKLKITKIKLSGNDMTLTMNGFVRSDRYRDYVPRARIVMVFDNGTENRRLPLVIKQEGTKDGVYTFSGRYRYELQHVFWKTQESTRKFSLRFQIFFGEEFEDQAEFDASEVIFERRDTLYSHEFKDKEVVFSYRPAKTVPLPGSIRSILTAVRTVCTVAIGIALIPWSVMEVLFSLFGAGGLSKRVRTRDYKTRLISQILSRFRDMTGIEVNRLWFKRSTLAVINVFSKARRVKKNKITFVSARNKEPSKNFTLVRDELARRGSYEFLFQTYTKPVEEMSFRELVKLSRALATSRIVLLEEYTPALKEIKMRKGTRLIQLWHAAGAFKTGGFARMGKPGGALQSNVAHRNYDYVTVSSKFCQYCHAEGFGLSDYNVVPTGIARTDVFFDAAYKTQKREEFYSRFPAFEDKKIVLFAPTFRGNSRKEAFYSFEHFDVGDVAEALGNDYALIIKHHPFVNGKHPIPKEYEDRVVDLTEGYDINDLLFVTDIVITDYSSLIYEASLLDIPMLFYTYDYTEYARDRDFYFDLKLLSPGKLVYSQEEIVNAIRNEDFHTENMKKFKELFFDHLDGKSSARIADLIEKEIKTRRNTK